MSSYKTTKYVNGPTNVLRLEGKIGNIKKVIYIFFDVHLYQTKCFSKYTLNIDQYIIRETKNNDLVYDLFIEIELMPLVRNKNSFYNSISEYITLIRQLFIKFNFKNNKIQNYNKNLRLHYIDYRTSNVLNIMDEALEINSCVNELNYLDIIIYINNLIGEVNIFIETLDNSLNKTKKDYTKNLKSYFDEYEKIYNNYNKVNNKDESYISYYYWKLNNTYKNKDVSKKIISLINNEVERLKNILVEYENILEKLKEFNFMNQLLYLRKKSQVEEFIDIGCKLIELSYDVIIITSSLCFEFHFIRRVLDKDYITNALFYAGILHSSNIPYLLIKYFNFKITHLNYNFTNLNLNEINNEFKNTKNFNNDLGYIFYPYLNRDKHRQCVIMEDFPDNFL